MLYALTQAVLLFAQNGEQKPPEAPVWAPFLPLVLIFVVFYFLIILPARRRERAQRDLLYTSLKKNDEVLTIGGIIGTVVNIKQEGDEVVLKVDDNVRVRIKRSAISQILTPKEVGKGPETGTEIKAGSPPSTQVKK
jgi:preprotein translocase subunit YajC